MTKHLILLTAILLISMMSNNFSLYGKGYGNKRDIELQERHNRQRPRCPSRQRIECFYIDGNIYIVFDVPEGNASLSITDLIDNSTYNYNFSTTSSSIIYVGDISHTSQLRIETDYGNVYEGYLTE
ncbi:hypothetical protein D7V95_09410 [bacterium J10(2018)]|nr:hypothetical protein D7V95_09410 [bacterium J10(2018)]